MRSARVGAMIVALCCTIALPSSTRAETVATPVASLDAIAWLEGDWRGEAFGGEIQEVWLPAAGEMMHGVFRLVAGGRVRISEYLQITVEESGVIMRFAHFRPDYSTVEGPGSFLELRLTEASDGHARFEATGPGSPDLIEYRRQEDGSVQVEVTGVDALLVMRRAP